MKIFIVHWHPEPKSFNTALFEKACSTFLDIGYKVKTSNLYEMGFDPTSGRHNFIYSMEPTYFKQQLEEMYASDHNGFTRVLEEEMMKMEWCDLMIWNFPLWWFGLPAVFKGWVDRVFAMGRMYGGGRMFDKGKFKGKLAMLSITTGGPASAYVKGGSNGDIYGVLRPIHRGMLEFVGFEVLEPNIIYSPTHMTAEQRSESIAAYEERLRLITDESPIKIGEY